MANDLLGVVRKGALLAGTGIVLMSCQSVPNPFGPTDLAASIQDDGTACYASHRVPFYREAGGARQIESALTEMFTDIFNDLIRSQFTGYSSRFGDALAQNFTEGMNGLLTDVTGERQRIQSVSTRFDALVDCRRQEANEIQAAYNAGQLSRTAAVARMERLQQLTQEDIAVARETNAVLIERNSEFELATQRARQEAVVATTPTLRQEREQQVNEAVEAVQTNQVALNESTASVDEAEALTSGTDGIFNLTG